MNAAKMVQHCKTSQHVEILHNKIMLVIYVESSFGLFSDFQHFYMFSKYTKEIRDKRKGFQGKA